MVHLFFSVFSFRRRRYVVAPSREGGDFTDDADDEINHEAHEAHEEKINIKPSCSSCSSWFNWPLCPLCTLWQNCGFSRVGWALPTLFMFSIASAQTGGLCKIEKSSIDNRKTAKFDQPPQGRYVLASAVRPWAVKPSPLLPSPHSGRHRAMFGVNR